MQGVALSQYLFSPDIGADRCGFKVGSGADRCANSARPVRLVSPAAILCRLVYGHQEHLVPLVAPSSHDCSNQLLGLATDAGRQFQSFMTLIQCTAFMRIHVWKYVILVNFVYQQ